MTGPGGTGKTRLAVAAADRLRETFADGVYLVDLTPVTDATSVIPTMARALGLRDSHRITPQEALREFVRDRRILIVLDNFERVLVAAAGLAELLAACGGIRLLVTSRESLQSRWEHVFPVTPLALPDVRESRSSQLASVPAVALFVERAQAAQPAFRLTDDNSAIVAEICVHLDGLPLAIELAAARTNVLSVTTIRERLSARLDLLRRTGPDQAQRHHTLRATVDWSYSLLSAGEQILLQRLAIFADGWTLDAAMRICSGGELQEECILELLDSLVRHSLVVPEHAQDSSRYRFLETVHIYASERLARSGEEPSLRRRHTDWFCALSEATPAELFDTRTVEREAHNLRGALRWSIDVGDAHAAARLCEAMWPLWSIHRDAEGRIYCGAVLGLSGLQEPTQQRAMLLAWYSNLVYARGDLHEGEVLAKESLALARSLRDLRTISIANTFLGHIARYANLESARSYYHEALTAARAVSNWMLETHILCFTARVEQEQGHHAEAEDLCSRSLAIARAQSNRYMIARSLQILGEIAASRGDLRSSRARIGEAFQLHSEAGDKQGQISALLALARIGSDYGSARQYLVDSLSLSHESGDRVSLARGLDGLAVLFARRNPERGVRLAAAAEALKARTGAASLPAEKRCLEQALSQACHRLGENRFALAWEQGGQLAIDQALVLAREGGARPKAAHLKTWPLTERQKEVAALVAAGRTNRQIAELLVITERTAEHHVENILTKLRVNSRTQLGIWAAEHGLTWRAT